ncbi:MAG: hypothetical protein IPL23_29865 [Saprospiraceae bacterium]|nr:hypothetical protein [Saprospiraceae bacterium]
MFNQIVLSAEIKSYDTSEIAFVYESHMDKIQPGKEFQLGRSALWKLQDVFFSVNRKGADFCIQNVKTTGGM